MSNSPIYQSKANRDHHVSWVIEHEVELLALTDRLYYGAEQILRIKKNHDFPTYPARYRAPYGRFVITRDPVMIVPVYIILLEKMREYLVSYAVPKLMHFGTLSTITQVDKYALPWRNVPTRLAGESDIRLFWRLVHKPSIIIANTPAMQKAVGKLLLHENPMRIDNLMDESVSPLGRNRPVQMYKHMQACRGIRFERQLLTEGAA